MTALKNFNRITFTAVDVVIKNTQGQFIHKLHPNVRIIRVPTFHRYSGVPYIVRYLWKTPSSAIIVPSERLAAIALAARQFAIHRPRVAACVHNIDPNWLSGETTPAYQKRLRRIRHYYPRCDSVICVSGDLRTRFLQETEIPDQNVHTIYNPVVTKDLYRLAEETIAHPWFQKDTPPVILGTARLEPQKGLDTLIRAFAEVPSTPGLSLGNFRRRESAGRIRAVNRGVAIGQ